MKSPLKHAGRALWRGLAPVRRPLARKLDAWIGGVVETRVRALIVEEHGRLRPALDATTATVREHIDRNEDTVGYLRRTSRENTLLLDSLVRELVRMQAQLESIRRDVEDLAPDGADGANSSAERLMIG